MYRKRRKIYESNRGAMGAPPVAGGDADCHVAALLAMTRSDGSAVKYRKRRKINDSNRDCSSGGGLCCNRANRLKPA